MAKKETREIIIPARAFPLGALKSQIIPKRNATTKRTIPKGAAIILIVSTNPITARIKATNPVVLCPLFQEDGTVVSSVIFKMIEK
ncbi:MAG: hypothetical protein LBH96_02220 [Candidatus Peribacteria bacterium]|jgi:hypothetical protein|nr:hypothetical protein [Candidatus Peribacteria bacterium]